MGCGASKMQPDAEARYRPILRRRLEEFMARRNAGLSKKQLLAGEGILPHEYEAETTKEDETKDCDHIFHDTQDCPPSPQKMAPTIIHDNEVHNRNVDDHNDSNVDGHNDYTIDGHNDNNVDDHNGSNVDDHNGSNVGDHENYFHDHNDNIVDDHIDNKVDDEQKCKGNKGDDANVEEEEKKVHEVEVSNKKLLHEEEAKCSVDDDDIEGMEFYPGSPSFRVYCVNNSDEELEDTAEHHDCEDCNKEDEKDCIRQESSNSNEVAEEKKQKRRRKFKRISIPKGGKKVLHSMHSFYNFPCNSNNSQLMQQETVPQPKPNVKEV